MLGLNTVDERIRIFPPAAAIVDNLSVIALSTAVQSAIELLITGPRNRALSYKESTDAWTLAFTFPFEIELSELPSIFMGRPSRVFTTMLA